MRRHRVKLYSAKLVVFAGNTTTCKTVAAEQLLFVLRGLTSIKCPPREEGVKRFPDLTYFQLNIFNTFAGFLSSFPNFPSKFAQFYMGGVGGGVGEWGSTKNHWLSRRDRK